MTVHRPMKDSKNFLHIINSENNTQHIVTDIFFHTTFPHSGKEVIYSPETLHFSSLTDFHTQTEVIYGSQNESV